MPTRGLMGPVGNRSEAAPVSTARTGSTPYQHCVEHGRALAGSGGALEIVGPVVGSGGVAPGRDIDELGERGGVVEGCGVRDAGQCRTLEQAFHRHLEPLAGHGVRQCLHGDDVVGHVARRDLDPDPLPDPGDEFGGEGLPVREDDEERHPVTAIGFLDPDHQRFRDGVELVRIGRELPDILHGVLTQTREGRLEIGFVHKGLEEAVHQVSVAFNRLVIAFIVMGGLLGSSLIGIFAHTGPKALGVNVISVGGFVLSGVLGLWLLWGVIRSGRL